MGRMALDDIVVLDLSRAYAGPFCSMILADMGAKVFKIEDPKEGDFTRRLPPFGEGPAGENSAYFANLNCNKLGITLNLKHPKAVEIFKTMAKKADIVIENYTPRVMKSLGLSWEELHRINPRLIMASLSCYGQDGPYAQRPGYDGIGQAMGGICSLNGPADGAPTRVGPPLGDSVCALYAAIGILTALHARERTGEGQWVDVSQQDAIFSLLEAALAAYFLKGEVRTRTGSRHLYVGPYDIFPCKDGYVFFAGYLDHQWQRTCEIFGELELGRHPDLSSLQKRSEPANLERLIYPKLLEWFSRYTKKELEAMCAEEIPLCPVLDVGECATDPQLIHRRMVAEVDHPYMGRLKVPGRVVKLSDTPGAGRFPPPTLGQHNETVFGELLGISPDQLREIKEQGVI